MFQIQNYSAFILAVLLFQLIPGAGTIAILNAAARKGVRGGMGAVFGTLTGDFIYMSAAVLGLAAILGAYPAILAGAQWIGVAYLCGFGLRLVFGPKTTCSGDGGPVKGGWTFYRQALAVSLTNPKAIMFFMAFFPLFIAEGAGPVTLFVLMAHVTVISLVYQTLLVLVGNIVARRLSRWPLARPIATRLAGAALVGFGVRLALGDR